MTHLDLTPDERELLDAFTSYTLSGLLANPSDTKDIPDIVSLVHEVAQTVILTRRLVSPHD